MSTPRYTLHLGDCLDVLRTLDAGSVDAVVTDPPYGLEFMGKEWDVFRGEAWRSGSGFSKPGIGERETAWPAFGGGDSANATCAACGGRMRGAKKCQCPAPEWHVKGKPIGERNARLDSMRAFQAWCEAWAREVFRVLKPGALLFAFGGTRTYHRMASGVEDAGFHVEDAVAWLHGQGFPKHKSKFKPAHEPIVVARKPGPKWLGVDAGRIAGHNPSIDRRNGKAPGVSVGATGWVSAARPASYNEQKPGESLGRWPANVALSHHPECNGHCHADCPVRLLDEQSGERKSGKAGRNGHRRHARTTGGIYGNGDGLFTEAGDAGTLYGDAGGVSRFFYCSKASRFDRNEGLDGMPLRKRSDEGYGTIQQPKLDRACPRENWTPHATANHHPTVKPTDLMRWLCRLACPPGGVILDPFSGSGSTGKAAILEGFGFVGVEREPDYHAIAARRLAAAANSMPLFAGATA